MHRSVCVSFSFSLLYSLSAAFHRLPAAIIVPCPRQSENEAKPELLCDPQEFVLTLFGVAQFLWYLLSDCQNGPDRAERCVTACRMICLTDVLKQHSPSFIFETLTKSLFCGTINTEIQTLLSLISFRLARYTSHRRRYPVWKRARSRTFATAWHKYRNPSGSTLFEWFRRDFRFYQMIRCVPVILSHCLQHRHTSCRSGFHIVPSSSVQAP